MSYGVVRSGIYDSSGAVEIAKPLQVQRRVQPPGPLAVADQPLFAPHRVGHQITASRIALCQLLEVPRQWLVYRWTLCIELVSPTDSQSAVGRALESRGEGIYSVVFAVENVAQTPSAIKDAGARLSGEGSAQVFVHPQIHSRGTRAAHWPRLAYPRGGVKRAPVLRQSGAQYRLKSTLPNRAAPVINIKV